MFTKILIPTDGSPLGNLAALEGVAMAKKVGANVAAIYVSRELQNPLFDFSVHRPTNYPTKEEFRESVNAAGKEILSSLKEAAEEAGVAFEKCIEISNATAFKIIEKAEDLGCSMIFMGSHGCAGWGNKLLGSVSTKVLANSDIPVLIYRMKKEPELDVVESVLRRTNKYMVP